MAEIGNRLGYAELANLCPSTWTSPALPLVGARTFLSVSGPRDGGTLYGTRLRGACLLKICLGLLDLMVMFVDGLLEDLHVGFARLLRQPLEPLAFAPALIGQLLKRGPHALGFRVCGVLEQLSGEPESTFLECEDVVHKVLVGVLDLLEDLLKFLLRSLVVHHLCDHALLLLRHDGTTVGILEKRPYSATLPATVAVVAALTMGLTGWEIRYRNLDSDRSSVLLCLGVRVRCGSVTTPPSKEGGFSAHAFGNPIRYVLKAPSGPKSVFRPGFAWRRALALKCTAGHRE